MTPQIGNSQGFHIIKRSGIVGFSFDVPSMAAAAFACDGSGSDLLVMPAGSEEAATGGFSMAEAPLALDGGGVPGHERVGRFGKL